MYDVTILYNMSADELVAFAKGIISSDLWSTDMGKFYAEEAMNIAKLRINELKHK